MVKSLLFGAVLVASALAAWLWTGGGERAGHAAVAPPAAPKAPPPAAVGHRGVAIQVASGHYRVRETYGPLLQEIADLGANSVLLCFPAHMEHARAQAIFLDIRKIPPPDDIHWLLRRARELGLRPFVMPVVLLRHPRGSEWRGVIDPPDWDEWWEQYREVVVYFADACREGQAEALLVGSELVSTEKYTARWKEVIRAAREHFAGGKLGYSANWDHYRPIEFWEQLDFVGMTSYNTLAEKKDPSVDEIVKRWEPVKREILAWQRQVGKPILMTEVGWCSQEGAATAPWNYYQNQVATEAGHEEQRRLYEAFIRVWGAAPELMGVIWWEWGTAPGGASDFGYTPKGKPAEKLLRAWLGGPASGPDSRPSLAAP